MSKIKKGSIEYYELINLKNQLSNRNLNKLDLQNLDRLRFEVQLTLDLINESKQKN